VVDGRVRQHAVGGGGEQGFRAGRHLRRRTGGGTLYGRGSPLTAGEAGYEIARSSPRRLAAEKRRALNLDDGWELDAGLDTSAAAAGRLSYSCSTCSAAYFKFLYGARCAQTNRRAAPPAAAAGHTHLFGLVQFCIFFSYEA
jgi:hypothetical protein